MDDLFPIFYVFDLISVAVIMWRCIKVAGIVSKNFFGGHRIRYGFFGMGYALMSYGSIASLIDMVFDPGDLMVVGLAVYLLASRRFHRYGEKKDRN